MPEVFRKHRLATKATALGLALLVPGAPIAASAAHLAYSVGSHQHSANKTAALSGPDAMSAPATKMPCHEAREQSSSPSNVQTKRARRLPCHGSTGCSCDHGDGIRAVPCGCGRNHVGVLPVLDKWLRDRPKAIAPNEFVRPIYWSLLAAQPRLGSAPEPPPPVVSR